ncbi:ABC-three component system protein [Herbaspirillum frisingense]|uniref:ABC-three component systems C-terminal domain-containing protein n=1 Tax=Herbaspirillum frisingense TaxID=92645 RepID=A0ABU1PC02_9BURK|nr:ABC-three component system protein [Herbaspirillum frisingense]MDR6583447.1 hypothetical protein [Herbaspirillum frisingense]
MTNNASATAAGFTYQFQRALFRLVDALDGDICVGIETMDDIVELKILPDGTVHGVFEQDKLSTRKKNNLQDSSPNVWKTVSNWLKQLDALRDAYRSHTFLFATNRVIPRNTIVQQMAVASSDDSCVECIDQIKKIASMADGEAKEYLLEILRAPLDKLIYLIKNIDLLDGDSNAEHLSTKSKTIQRFQLESALLPMGEQIYQNLLGHIVDECQKNWLQKKQAWFLVQKIRDRLRQEINLRAVDRYIDRDMFSTEFQSYVRNDTKDHLFLQQLARINLDQEFIIDELDNYWAFYCERNRLIEEGVLPTHWHNRESKLHNRWKIINRNVRLSKDIEANEEARGMELYKQTISADYKENLAGNNTNHLYFTHGHYQHLANDNQHRCYIYWHADFKSDSKK